MKITIQDENKEISFIWKGKRRTLKFQIKRAYTVCINILKAYPKYMDIHSLDKVLNDPNRAISDLKNEDGYANFLIERRNTLRNNEYKLNLIKLFNQYPHESIIQLGTRTRLNPSSLLKEQLKEKFNMRCNITGIKLHETIQGQFFLKNMYIMQYDHRIPLSKGGSEDPTNIENWQLLSELVNREKNKMCNSCQSIDCKNCALAFPENHSIIKANNQCIKEFINNRNIFNK